MGDRNDAHKLCGGRRGLLLHASRGGQGRPVDGHVQIGQHRGDATCTRSAGEIYHQGKHALVFVWGCSCCDRPREVRQMLDEAGHRLGATH